MNSACQAIAAAKHSPKIFRLRNHHRVKGPGNSFCIEDAAKARYSQGIAHLTDSWIMEDTPAPLDRSVRVMAITMAMEIGPVMSQNRRHSLKALFFRISRSAMLMDSRYWSRADSLNIPDIN